MNNLLHDYYFVDGTEKCRDSKYIVLKNKCYIVPHTQYYNGDYSLEAYNEKYLYTRPCTLKEIIWLNMCIGKGAFIPFEELNFNNEELEYELC